MYEHPHKEATGTRSSAAIAIAISRAQPFLQLTDAQLGKPIGFVVFINTETGGLANTLIKRRLEGEAALPLPLSFGGLSRL